MPDRVALYTLFARDLFALLKAGDGRTPYCLGGLPDSPEIVRTRWTDAGLELVVRSPELDEVPDGGLIPRHVLVVGKVVPPPALDEDVSRTPERATNWLENDRLDDAMSIGRAMRACVRTLVAERDALRREVEEVRLILGDYREDNREADRLYRQGWREAIAQRDLKAAVTYERFHNVTGEQVTEAMARQAQELAAGIEPGTVIDIPQGAEFIPSPPAARYQPGMPTEAESRRLLMALDVDNTETARGASNVNIALRDSFPFGIPPHLAGDAGPINYAGTLMSGWDRHAPRLIPEVGTPLTEGVTVEPTPEGEVVTEVTEEGDVALVDAWQAIGAAVAADAPIAGRTCTLNAGRTYPLPPDWLTRDYTAEAIEAAWRIGEELGRQAAERHERRVIEAVLGESRPGETKEES